MPIHSRSASFMQGQKSSPQCVPSARHTAGASGCWVKAWISKEVVCIAGQELFKKMLQFILKNYGIILMVILFISIFLAMHKALATHSSTLAWKIPWTEEPGRLQSVGSLRVRHN